MPAPKQPPAAPTPASPRNTAKYTNKDGSKFITVPKGSASESSQPSTPTTSAKAVDQPAAAPLSLDSSLPAVNRKKQKRRQKAAAKAAAEQAANGHANPALASPNVHDAPTGDQDLNASDDEADELNDPGESFAAPNGHAELSSAKSKKNKKKNKKAGFVSSAGHTPPPAPLDSPANPHVSTRGPGMSRDKIWSTSNHEERERIKEFWLGLGEEERKSLVKVEKDAVLKKMKEQQKHTCSCTVCGRKRTAIEEELEGLYDAYYLELEQFANQGEGPPMLPPPPRDFPIRPPRRLPTRYATQPPSRGRIVEHVGDDDDEEFDEVYSEDEVDEDEFSDDEPPEEFHSTHDRDVADFLTFGNSLQVKGTQLLETLLSAYGNMDLGGILTVADDLLKNDGKRFIEMMEQLAERRMAREEDAREHFSRAFPPYPNGSHANPHNHPPPEEDEYEEEEDEEDDYEDSQEEEYEDEEDQMTEEQRMEEGRRMFQIFAARMFEQRVLSAYKEKVAKERQQKLLEELEEESRQVDQQKAKKAKNAQKKKDKAAQKKQALAEEKARKDAEKAAEEAARLEAEQRRAAEQRQKAEEKRKQKEAQRKAEEEARLKKEADRQRRIHEQREKQAELERKAREAKEREKRLKEEQRQREKEAREQREREAQERKEKQERDKRDKEARAAAHKAQRESQESGGRDKAREEKAPQKSAAQHHGPSQSTTKRVQPPHHPVTIPIPTILPQHPPNPANYASPKIPVATPAIPKAPTPMRTRTVSQQQAESLSQPNPAPVQGVSGLSQNPSPIPVTPAHSSPAPIGQERKASGGGLPLSMQPQHASQPLSPQASHSRPPSQTPPYQVPPMPIQPPPGLAHQRPPGFPSPMGHDAMFPLGFRPGHNVMMPPPGINGPAGRGFPPMPIPPPGFTPGPPGVEQYPLAQPFAMPKDLPPPPSHVRQGSTGFDGASSMPSQPIVRPAPIGRPGSISHGMPRDDEVDAKRLGSRVLVEDDEPLATETMQGSYRHQPPGPRNGGFATSPFMDAGYPVGHSPWGMPSNGAQPFPPPGFGATAWASPTMPPGFHVGSPAPGLSTIRASAQPRHVTVRLMLCQACKDLASSSSSDADGFVDLGDIKTQIGAQTGDASITAQDLLNLCDTEGNASNGGGSFEVRRDANRHAIRWSPDASEGLNPHFRAVGAPGEIGSPLTSHASVSPLKRPQSLLERIGVASRNSALEPMLKLAGPSRSSAHSRTASSTTDNSSKLDTWEGFFDFGTVPRRYHSEK
ncbi:hypothetical protein HIM_07320 [Hirsutella minnesotensis 3608]|uniref:Stress response protein NST1 n=1 Tax=Hirsutella minnesotensis 3608 TaxID=1043627 RepID=A0A0F7ZI05_9HYPO|nr:hypothetical protein HIM_07320 [Hirsutella minnesotensis 3608]